MMRILGVTLLLAASASASASLNEVCQRTIEAQGNLAAAVKYGDSSYVKKAMAAGKPLGYDDSWYNNELTRMRLNAQDRESMYYLADKGSSGYQSIHNRYMKTCTTLPAQYLTSFNDLASRGLISKSEVAKAEKPDFSNIEGMRAQQGGGGLKARAASGRAAMEAQNEALKAQ